MRLAQTITLVTLLSILAGCAHPSEGRHPSTIATAQATVVDDIVEGWYSRARSHPDCRLRLDRGDGPPEPYPHFARIRSPVLLVLSNPEIIGSRESCRIGDGHGGCDDLVLHTVVRFRSARILYAKDNEYAQIMPSEFVLTESLDARTIAREFIDDSRTYAVFANFIEFWRPPRLEAVAVCDLSDPQTLPALFGTSAP